MMSSSVLPYPSSPDGRRASRSRSPTARARACSNVTGSPSRAGCDVEGDLDVGRPPRAVVGAGLEAADDAVPVMCPSRRGRCRPRPSQTRTCAIHASGSSQDSFARDGVAMDDPRLRQGILSEENAETIPAQVPPARPPGQPEAPDPAHVVGVSAPPLAIGRDEVVSKKRYNLAEKDRM